MNEVSYDENIIYRKRAPVVSNVESKQWNTYVP